MKQAWDIFEYEVMQLNELWKHFQAGRHNGLPLEIRNAMVESAVLHLRIILEMLEDKPEKPDDYCLSDLIDMKNKPPTLAALIKIYNDSSTYSALVEKHLGGDPAKIAPLLKRSPRDQTNKLMVHPTKLRSTSHDWSPILNILAPKINPVIEDLRRCAVR